MAMTKEKRKKMEDLLYSTLAIVDPTKGNVEKYKAKLAHLSNDQFDKFFKELFNSKHPYITLDVIDFERIIKMDNVIKALEHIDVPLFEYVAMPYTNMDKENPVVTPIPVFVGWTHVKRTQQTTLKKNTASTSIAKRSALTNQVIGEDKNARDSDAENFALTTMGVKDTIREFMGPRADDQTMKKEMYNQIATHGYATLNSLTDDVSNKHTLNTIDRMYIAMCLKTDWVNKGLVLQSTLNKK